MPAKNASKNTRNSTWPSQPCPDACRRQPMLRSNCRPSTGPRSPPSINHCVSAEMFKLKQRKFQEKLQQKKQQTATTKPHSPKFTPVKQKIVDRGNLNESSPLTKPSPLARRRSSQPALEPPSWRCKGADSNLKRASCQKLRHKSVPRRTLRKKWLD